MVKVVVLYNLGGPRQLEDVQPFLFNLFNDPAIFSLPQPFRSALAWLVAKTRTAKASEIYRYLGGGSPIFENTQAQAQALEQKLGSNYKVFTIMRYWHPRAAQVIENIKEFNPEHIYLLPLYPQYSTSTTASSIIEFLKIAKIKNLTAPHSTFCCYPTDPLWIEAQVDLIKERIGQEKRPYRFLFSAHGLPERTIEKGDPYQNHVEQTVHAVMKSFPDQDYQICYQSRVGPLKWIGPTTESEINRAGLDQKGIVLIPISFVSEHSETLYELDHLYGELAHDEKVPFYYRVPTVSTCEKFIDMLANLVLSARDKMPGLISPHICPPKCTQGLCYLGIK